MKMFSYFWRVFEAQGTSYAIALLGSFTSSQQRASRAKNSHPGKRGEPRRKTKEATLSTVHFRIWPEFAKEKQEQTSQRGGSLGLLSGRKRAVRMGNKVMLFLETSPPAGGCAGWWKSG